MNNASYSNILIGIDGSGFASQALRIAASLASETASLTVLHVIDEKTHRELLEFGRIEHLETTEPSVVLGERLLEDALRELQSFGQEVAATLLRKGDVVGEIIDCATELKSDIVVMGSRGLKPGIRSYIGSVSNAVLHSAPCNCLIVR